ncbi:glycoside hydrolase family 13 protein [Lacticaseibacillus saniviri]|uniref:Alpha amylase, catalytic domain protein n=1 Tax=Lacticaseibacillus saniviri JCM 17471 = DSM 24301 TaxID=1293598 RepID=A0A0R2MXE4_9LACO|nr:alpha-glucosidase [Lacticaseibacillus saniviri]KRO16880.1 alpha amylase, catalytic domain protein [Lacticaseibacillus saniviri JCM 17471 = DSM 24301]MCG4281704.1 alpha-glucosidase [Lacticaseibacillus saniviri]
MAWWQERVGYQIYPKSFQDTNGDGIGDLQGIQNRIPYLKRLGVGFVWLSPIYLSPNIDNGYDISDYQAIDPQYGDLKQFDQLVSAFHEADIKVVMDLVLNHTSDQHDWFVQAASSRDNPYHDFYIWKDAKNGVPNNWQSIFGGSAWQYNQATDEYYLHIFATEQPDLNWENPQVRLAIYKMIEWWVLRGVDGFRLDAIIHLKKLQSFADVDDMDLAMRNVAGIDVFLKELGQLFKQNDVMTVGEAMGAPIEDAAKWVSADHGYFNMIFQFEHTQFFESGHLADLSVPKLKSVLTKWQNELNDDGWNALFIENHDLPRAVSTYGDDSEYWLASAKCLAAWYFLMKGTPFIYQGQELGMINADYPRIEDYQDIATHNQYDQLIKAGKSAADALAIVQKISRDNARTPMQWNDQENAGFTTGTPWLEVTPDYKLINAANQVDDDSSVFNFYRTLIHLRATTPALISGRYDLLETPGDQIYAYSRTLGDQQYIIAANLSTESANFDFAPELQPCVKQLVLGNYIFKTDFLTNDVSKLILQPFEVAVYKVSVN